MSKMPKKKHNCQTNRLVGLRQLWLWLQTQTPTNLIGDLPYNGAKFKGGCQSIGIIGQLMLHLPCKGCINWYWSSISYYQNSSIPNGCSSVLGSFRKMSERKAERGKLWCIYRYILCIYVYIYKLSAYRIQSIKSDTHPKTNHRNTLLWRMNWRLLLDGKDANGKLLLDFHGSESLIFFVQLYPTATKRPYSSSKIVSENGFTMFFPIDFPLFFGNHHPFSWTSWKPQTKTLITHTSSTWIFPNKKNTWNPNLPLFFEGTKKTLNPSRPTFWPKRREEAGPQFGFQVYRAPRIISCWHLDFFMLTIEPCC